MRRIIGFLIIALTLLFVGRAEALITIVGSATSAVGNVTVTPTVGHMLIATVRSVDTPQNGTVVTDNSHANVWQRAVSCSNGAIDDDEIWFALNVVGGTYQVTAAKNGSKPLTVSEWAGAQRLTVAGACGLGSATTTVLGGIIAPVNNTDLIISDWASATASSTLSGRTCASCTGTPTTWNQLSATITAPSGESAYIIGTAAGNFQYQITAASAVTYAAAEAAFAAAPVQTPTATPSLTPTPTQTPTQTPTPTASQSPSPTPTAVASAVMSLVNIQGYQGVPITAPACPSVATVFRGRRSRVTWAFMPEGGDIRCETGTSDSGAPIVAPSATVGFLFKSNVLVPESTISQGSSGATLRLDCCGVSGAVPVSSWEEGPAPSAVPTQTPTPTPTLTPTPTPT